MYFVSEKRLNGLNAATSFLNNPENVRLYHRPKETIENKNISTTVTYDTLTLLEIDSTPSCIKGKILRMFQTVTAKINQINFSEKE